MEKVCNIIATHKLAFSCRNGFSFAIIVSFLSLHAAAAVLMVLLLLLEDKLTKKFRISGTWGTFSTNKCFVR